MGTLRLTYTRVSDKTKATDEQDYYCLPMSDFKRFNASLLDLGDVQADGKYFEALAAIFDLEAFTSFTNQIDPHLVIPEFLNEFLNWLFKNISDEFLTRRDGNRAILWGELPFFAKFLGDGVLFLWDTRNLDYDGIGNVVVNLLNVCNEYQNNFLPNIKKTVTRPPTKLRCGIARGQIISIGEGKDFVGPCINVASRLQKLGKFSFAFSKRGFNLDRGFAEASKNVFTLIRSSIRGVGEEELIYVRKKEFDLLSEEERNQLLT